MHAHSHIIQSVTAMGSSFFHIETQGSHLRRQTLPYTAEASAQALL